MEFHQTKLDNGLEVIAEANPHAQSAAVGFFVWTGSRDEDERTNGVSHFLEHMVFKGTARRTALDVNREFDEMGARYNAFTSEENTAFWAAVLPEYLPRAVDLLSDILQPSLRDEDFEMEKNVILEEISMYEDQPSFSAYEKCMAAHFGNHPLGLSILGTTDTIGALTCEQMRGYFGERYRPGNIVLAAAGAVDWNSFRNLAAEHCGRWQSGPSQRRIGESSGGGELRVLAKEQVKQEHVVQLAMAPPATSADRFAAELVATIVGDDTGSRFYWELVDPGRAESASTSYHEFHDAGVYLTFLGCDPQWAEDNLRRMQGIYRQVTEDGVSPDEIEQAKNKIAARAVLRSERPMGRLIPLGYNWTYRREHRSVEDDLADIAAVTPESIRRVLREFPLDNLTTVAIGPLDEIKLSDV